MSYGMGGDKQRRELELVDELIELVDRHAKPDDGPEDMGGGMEPDKPAGALVVEVGGGGDSAKCPHCGK